MQAIFDMPEKNGKKRRIQWKRGGDRDYMMRSEKRPSYGGGTGGRRRPPRAGIGYTILTLVLLVVLFPIGLIFLWARKLRWQVSTKLLTTVVCGLIFFFVAAAALNVQTDNAFYTGLQNDVKGGLTYVSDMTGESIDRALAWGDDRVNDVKTLAGTLGEYGQIKAAEGVLMANDNVQAVLTGGKDLAIDATQQALTQVDGILNPTDTPAPTELPTEEPTPEPTLAPTEEPTVEPTLLPTEVSTEMPVVAATAAAVLPTEAGNTEEPNTRIAAMTENPAAVVERATADVIDWLHEATAAPTDDPSAVLPSAEVLPASTDEPTEVLLTEAPVVLVPEASSVVAITAEPAATELPTAEPAATELPTPEPTAEPTIEPTPAPTEIVLPTVKPAGDAPVYFTERGKFYHTTNDCSGMNVSTVRTFAEAIAAGKKQCMECAAPSPDLLETDSIVLWADDGNVVHTSNDCPVFAGSYRLMKLEDLLNGEYTFCPECGANIDQEYALGGAYPQALAPTVEPTLEPTAEATPEITEAPVDMEAVYAYEKGIVVYYADASKSYHANTSCQDMADEKYVHTLYDALHVDHKGRCGLCFPLTEQEIIDQRLYAAAAGE